MAPSGMIEVTATWSFNPGGKEWRMASAHYCQFFCRLEIAFSSALTMFQIDSWSFQLLECFLCVPHALVMYHLCLAHCIPSSAEGSSKVHGK